MKLGQKGEQIALNKYLELGYTFLQKNLRLHQSRQIGEIDLILTKDKELVFVEVKTRSNKSFGEAEEAVSFAKQRKLVRAAKLYLLGRPQYDTWNWRFDVATVNIDKNGVFDIMILENVIEDY